MLLSNYFLSAWRNIFKHSLFSAINILGLSIGLAACILISLFVRDELSYDGFWTNTDQIYRTHTTFQVPGRDPVNSVQTPGPVKDALKKDFPQIINAARIANRRPTIIIENNHFLESISVADAEIIEMFDFNVLEGDLTAAMNDNYSLVLSQSLALKFFGTSSPINKTITMKFDGFTKDYRIAAIIEDMPENSQLNISGMIAIDEEAWSVASYVFSEWFSVNAQLFYQINEGIDHDEILSNFPAFIDRNFPKLPFGGSEIKTSDMIKIVSLNMKDLHLKSVGFGEYRDAGDINMVIIFSAVAILILVIACINFMNLSTARASQRAKEVSLRKVMGASKRNLVTQFLGESILLTLFGLLLAVAIVEFSLPLYNDIIGKNLEISFFSIDAVFLILLALIVGIIGGAYPAFVLSAFRPVENLKANQSTETRSSINFRSALVVFQFAVSISLFVSTAVVYGQMLYAKNKDLGYNQSNMFLIHDVGRDEATTKLSTLVSELRRIPQIQNVTWSNFAPGFMSENNTTVRTEGMSQEEMMLLGRRYVGFEYFETYDIPLLAGREFEINRADEEYSTDAIRNGEISKGTAILNQSALRKLGFSTPEEAVNQVVYVGVGNPQENLEAELLVIGVVPDVHFNSLKSTIRPEFYELNQNYGSTITVRFNGDPRTVTNDIRALWEQEVSGIPFNYDFAVDTLAEQYSQEQGLATMFAAFAGLAILIASLGLYGLASFTADRRTKEIGIRKVMGASVFDVVKLLVWQFSKPVILANFIAWPVSYYVMILWLESFVYRLEAFLIFGFCLLAGIAALLLAWGTVASNSMRVAKSNPINALRYE